MQDPPGRNLRRDWRSTNKPAIRASMAAACVRVHHPAGLILRSDCEFRQLSEGI
jgi:hypothetical protein